MEINKENLKNYLEMKKSNIEEMRDKCEDINVFNGYSNQLFLIEAIMLELELDVLKYKLPKSVTKEQLDDLLTCEQEQAENFNIYEIHKRIDVLNEFIKLNGNNYNIFEVARAENMIRNYQYILCKKYK